MFVEGGTEEDYVVRLRDSVIATVDGRRGTPQQLVDHAVAAKRADASDAARGRGRAYDEIWCMFDVDEHHEVARAIARATDNQIRVAVSNPCVELWFVLHFEDQTAHIERRVARRRARRLLGCEKSLTERAFESLVEHHADAVARATSLERKHEGDGSPAGADPSSRVWSLIERMRRR